MKEFWPEKTRPSGRARLRWQDNIKTDVKEKSVRASKDSSGSR